MLYKKPNMKYTDMAIFIDEHAYRDDNSDEVEGLIYEYIYHIVNMLAHNGKYFTTSKMYDDFNVYVATRTYLRIKNPRQFKEDSPIKQIKSILNYLKSILPFAKIDFQQEDFAQTVIKLDEDVSDYNLDFSLYEQLIDSVDRFNTVEFDCCLGDICKTAKKYLTKIPYKQNTTEWLNIYLSCLLTFLNSITLKKKDVSKVMQLQSDTVKVAAIDNLYKQEAQNCVILYHLDSNMQDYIDVLTREIKREIARDLSYTSHTYISSCEATKTLAYSELGGDQTYEHSEEI